jgi:hypothetical protein
VNRWTLLACALLSGVLWAQVPLTDAQYAEASRMAAERGEITYLYRSQNMKARGAIAQPLSPLDQEYWAYHAMLSEQMDARKLTFPQFEYAMAQKRNELIARSAPPSVQVVPVYPAPVYNMPSCASITNPYLRGQMQARGTCYY